MGVSAIYLGNSLILGQNRSKEFSKLKDRVQGRLEGWRKNSLSKARKVELIKSVLQMIPTYTMVIFKDLDRTVKRFWWSSKQNKGRYLALKKWDKICKPKANGGLSFRRFAYINITLLSKLVWKLAKREEAL